MNLYKTQQLIRQDEGYRRVAYKDTQGIWTIGIGHNLRADGLKPEQCDGLSWPDAKIETVFIADIQRVIAFVGVYWPWWRDFDDVRQAVLVSMGFVHGSKGMLAFKPTLEHFRACEWGDVREHLMKSLWYKQAKSRVERLIRMCETGQWPS